MLAEFQEDGHTELIFPCDCRNGDYLRISWDDDGEADPFRYLWIEGCHPERAPLRTRLRAAVSLIVGRRVPHTEIMLDDVTTRALTDFLVTDLMANVEATRFAQLSDLNERLGSLVDTFRSQAVGADDRDRLNGNAEGVEMARAFLLEMAYFEPPVVRSAS